MHGLSAANGPEGGTEWQRVNWRKAERAVRNLRQRIFRAAQQGPGRSLLSSLVICLSRMRCEAPVRF
jgi:hypothetical protein